MLKLLVIGNNMAGKTQFINRFVSNDFEKDYKPTVVCDFAIKIIEIEGNEIRL